MTTNIVELSEEVNPKEKFEERVAKWENMCYIEHIV
jgi:hypothetical protein